MNTRDKYDLFVLGDLDLTGQPRYRPTRAVAYRESTVEGLLVATLYALGTLFWWLFLGL